MGSLYSVVLPCDKMCWPFPRSFLTKKIRALTLYLFFSNVFRFPVTLSSTKRGLTGYTERAYLQYGVFLKALLQLNHNTIDSSSPLHKCSFWNESFVKSLYSFFWAPALFKQQIDF